MIEQKLEVRKGSGSGESLTKVQAQIRVDRASCTNRQTFLPYFQCVIAGLVRVHLAPPKKIIPHQSLEAFFELAIVRDSQGHL